MEAATDSEVEGGVSISTFDHSVENFFAVMEEISALCAASGEEQSFEASEVQRFSSMTTFLKEWRHFCYEPKTIDFAYEAGSAVAKDAMKGISLSQFSSAAVPKMEKLPDRAILSDSNDFVLHAGGPVWALDWCPRTPEKSDNNIKCEYLAVAAHPPGSTYHKIGVPLIGRGVIQIWCLLNIDEEVEFLPPRPKRRGGFRKKPFREPSTAVRPRGRPRKRPVEKEQLYVSDAEDSSYSPRTMGRPKKKRILGIEDLNDMQELSLPKPRGRPRKRPILGLNGVKASSLARPRGRPRKRPLPGVTNLSGKGESPPHSNSPVPSINESIPPLSVDLGEVALALPAPADLNAKEESFVPRHRGRPRKKPIPNVNDSTPASGVELGEDSSALSTSGGLGNSNVEGLNVDLEVVALALPASADLNVKEEALVTRPRGRPRKRPLPDVTNLSGKGESPPHSNSPVPSVNESIPPLSVDLGEVALALPAPADLNAKEESFVPKSRGRPRKKPIPIVNDCTPTSGVELGEDSSALPTSGGLGNSTVKGLNVDLEEAALALPASADLNVKEEALVTMPRGRPRKKPIPSGNECAQAYGIKLWEDASAAPTSRRLENLSLNGLSIDLEEAPLSWLASADLNGKEESHVPRRRGRPRKKPIPNVNEFVPASGVESGKDPSALPTSRGLENLSLNGLSIDLEEVPLSLIFSADLNSKEETFVLKHRGRPRKKTIPNVNECVPASGVELGEDASAVPTSRGLENLSSNAFSIDLEEVPLALPASADLNGKEESLVPRSRGRPRKKPIPNFNKCVPAFGVELREDVSVLPNSRGFENSSRDGLSVDLEEVALALRASADLNGKEELSVPRHRGRPRKKPIPNVNECVPVSGVELGEDASAVPTSRGLENLSSNALSVDLEEVPFALPAFSDLNGKDESLVRRHRGRPRKKPIPNLNKCVPAFGVELREDVSVLPNSRGFENSSRNGLDVDLEEVALVLPASADLNGKEELSVPRHRGRPRKNPIPNVNECVPACGIELGEDASAVPSQGKQLSVTVEPTHDNHYQDAMVLSEEAAHNRSSNANTTRSVIPKGIALPRVVLCLAHNGKVAWDVKWRPSNVSTSEGKRHMGYLAVLLGNGSLEVWEVPLPSMVKTLYASCCSEGTDPRFLKLEPVFRCSKVKCGDRQSIPLTVEWSPSGSRDLILAGCHDGTVAMWKFSTHYSSQDTKPLLCFIADSVPIRALAWAPEESDAESANLIVTGGHEGLKFWDIRDPYRPLWDFNPVQRIILSLDWLKDPRCIILSFDDGTLKTISLWKAAFDVPITGKPFVGTKQQGMHSYQCSSFAIWSIQVSRTTGLVAYCSADGSARRFQLTAKSVEKDAKRYREPHLLCGSLTEESQTLKINTPLPNTPLLDIPFSMKKSLIDNGEAPRTICSYLSDANQVQQANSQFPALCSGDDGTIVLGSGDSQTSKPISSEKKKPKPDASPIAGQAFLPGEPGQGTFRSSGNQDGKSERKIEVLPPKIVAMHRVRWNMNKGSERWLCYGGAAGIIRCQEIDLLTTP